MKRQNTVKHRLERLWRLLQLVTSPGFDKMLRLLENNPHGCAEALEWAIKRYEDERLEWLRGHGGEHAWPNSTG